MYEQFITGKSVALVAPGSQTEIMKLGSLIDSYDIVARVGCYAESVPDELGSRTDIICENFWFWNDDHVMPMARRKSIYDMWVKQGVQFINYVWPNSKGLENFKEMNTNNIIVRMQPEDLQKQIRSTVNSPTKGLCSIHDFLNSPIKELFLVGFTACRGFSYRKDYVDPNIGAIIPYIDPKECAKDLCKWAYFNTSHRFKEEFSYIKNHVRGKVKMDEYMEKVFQCE